MMMMVVLDWEILRAGRGCSVVFECLLCYLLSDIFYLDQYNPCRR